MPSARRSAHSDYARLLRRPGYRGFVLTIALSRVSGAMFNVAGVLLVLQRTGSAGLAGITAAAAVLPGALTGPVLGAWLDVVERPKVLVVFDQLLGVVSLLALVVLAGHAANWTLPLVGVLYSITRPFSTGGFYGAMSELAGPELVDQASALDATSLNLGVVLGPALAGALAGLLGVVTTVELEAALSFIAVVAMIVNPAFNARSPRRAADLRSVVREGGRALIGNPILRAAAACSILANLGWGLMIVGFPLYAVQTLHSASHDAGYLWAALGVGSILGTFALTGPVTLRRIAISFGVLGLSALLWPLADTVITGVLLIGLTGVLEGPAFSGTIALRQRYGPPTARAQVVTTVVGLAGIAVSLGATLGGVIHDPRVLIYIFVGLNLLAAGMALAGAGRPEPISHPASD